jgi:hypothetical protein
MPISGGLVKNARSPRFKVRVTAEHIRNAVQSNGKHCMIADAIVDCYPGTASYVQVDLQSVRVTDLNKGLRYFYLTPRKAQTRLLAFDRGEHIAPFTFELYDAMVKKSGWRATHGEDWTPAENRQSKASPSNPPKRVVAPETRRFGLCLYNQPSWAEQPNV